MCHAGRAISTFFSKTLSARRAPFPSPPLCDHSFLSVASETGPRRTRDPRRPKRHFRRRFTSWLGGWSWAGARAGEGRRVSLRLALRGSAGWRAPSAAPALAAAPPPLRIAGRAGGRDNVAGLVAGNWVPAAEPTQVGAAGMLPRRAAGRPGRRRRQCSAGLAQP